MKKINFLKGMLVVAILFIANLTVFAGNPGDNLIYNAEEVNGVIVSETTRSLSASTVLQVILW